MVGSSLRGPGRCRSFVRRRLPRVPGGSTESAMSDELRNSLLEAIRSGQAVVIVGAGVSIAASQNPQVDGQYVASWPGLLRHGLQRCEALGRMKEKAISSYGDLLEEGDADDFVTVAAAITTKLGGPQGGEFARWLADTVGKLEPREPAAIQALR